MKTLKIDKEIIKDLYKSIDELRDKIESLELMSDPEVMKSFRKSKKEIANREFADWNELTKNCK